MTQAFYTLYRLLSIIIIYSAILNALGVGDHRNVLFHGKDDG
jgi:hypothetical protein